ncbi:MAG TPA: hypothetical protein DCR44_07875 [Acholeplasmatales bacterium]|nr:MAG: hypothetical protein A2Y16_01970 [Tenericutes bacterium GWF2_57_13]HAQ57293.1 hypothetical protein [Acholeplasmatales bacterium]
MKRDQSRLITAIILIVVGALLLADRLGWIDFTLFFAGWWTLFLIIPGVYSIAKNGVQVGNALLVVIGGIFLLQAWNLNLSSYLLPIALVLFGVVMLARKK